MTHATHWWLKLSPLIFHGWPHTEVASCVALRLESLLFPQCCSRLQPFNASSHHLLKLLLINSAYSAFSQTYIRFKLLEHDVRHDTALSNSTASKYETSILDIEGMRRLGVWSGNNTSTSLRVPVLLTTSTCGIRHYTCTLASTDAHEYGWVRVRVLVEKQVPASTSRAWTVIYPLF